MLNIIYWDIPFPNILKIYQRIGKKISIEENGISPLESLPISQNVWPNTLKIHIYISSLIKIYSISEWTQDTKVLILSLVLTIIFLRTLLIALILDEKYMCCSIKTPNSPQKYVAYSRDSFYLNFIGSEI